MQGVMEFMCKSKQEEKERKANGVEPNGGGKLRVEKA